MSGYDYIRYLTERMTTYLDTPRDKRDGRANRTDKQAPHQNQWLGMLPLAVKTYFHKKQSR